MATVRAKQLTLLFLQVGDQILLGMKKRGFGAGKYNGFGGKVDPHETLVNAAVREMVEESGVTVTNPKLHAHIVFEFVGHPEKLNVHVFKATEYVGTVKESEEMAPKWLVSIIKDTCIESCLGTTSQLARVQVQRQFDSIQPNVVG
jgi:8-oxo-dGTP diphosphatase/2-hydroxy-dATP diphosphatase